MLVLFEMMCMCEWGIMSLNITTKHCCNVRSFMCGGKISSVSLTRFLCLITSWRNQTMLCHCIPWLFSLFCLTTRTMSKTCQILAPHHCLVGAWAISQWLTSWAQDRGSIPRATTIDRSFILATSAIHLIAMVPVCLLGLTYAKVTLSLIWTSGQPAANRWQTGSQPRPNSTQTVPKWQFLWLKGHSSGGIPVYSAQYLEYPFLTKISQILNLWVGFGIWEQ